MAITIAMSSRKKIYGPGLRRQRYLTEAEYTLRTRVLMKLLIKLMQNSRQIILALNIGLDGNRVHMVTMCGEVREIGGRRASKKA